MVEDKTRSAPPIITREVIHSEILDIFREKFEIVDPGLDDNLGEKYEFDSIDAIELLTSVEDFLGVRLTQDEKKRAMDIRTVNHILDCVETLVKERSLDGGDPPAAG